jgi:hypothetical protein
MLPDLQKEYESQPVIHAIWEQFERALRRADRVFILGHSLSDQALIDSLQRNIEPLSRLAIGILAEQDDREQIDPCAMSMVSIVKSSLPSAAAIPVRFGLEPTISTRT